MIFNDNKQFHIGIREIAFIKEKLQEKYGKDKEFTEQEMSMICNVAMITCKMSKGAYYLEEER